MNRINDARPKRKRPSKCADKLKKARLLKKQKNTNVEVNLGCEDGGVNLSVPDTVPLSSSTLKKFSYINNINTLSEDSEQCLDSYMMVHSSVWQNIFKGCVCAHCGSASVIVQTSQTLGFAHKLVSKCDSCQTILNEVFTSPRVSCNDSTRPPFEVNRKVVDGFLQIGKGHAAIEQLSMVIGLPSMSTASYSAHLNVLADENMKVKEEILKFSQSAIRQAHVDVDPGLADENIINIAVSYDGTWHKRGHTSNYGLGIVIDILTGLVVDFHVLSRYCGTCEQKKKLLDIQSTEYVKWHESHKNNCECNFTGSANAMEVAAAEVLWKRSVEHKFRYTTMLSDGDAKTFNHLQKLAVYGPGEEVQISKQECLNHVAKRLKTGLKNIVAEWRVKKVTLGGKKQGNLKEDTIVKLGAYYRNAIIKNVPNVQQMKSAIYATLYHCMSTDQKPQHFKCPGGQDSWCFYNRALAAGDEPPPHDRTTMKTVLNSDVVVKMMPVYQRLASNELLERCTVGKTQNANEALHSVIWSRCPKEVFISKKKLEIGVASAIADFNMGCEVNQKLKENVTGTKLTASGQKICAARDKRRLQRSELSAQRGHKTARRKLKLTKTVSELKKKKEEGPMYAAGKF